MPVIDKAKFFAEIGYVPTAGQWAYHNSLARFRCPVCGRRFGKSTMAARDLEPKLFQEKKRFWIVGPTYDLGEKEFRVVWDDLIVAKGFGRDKRIKKAYNKKSGDLYIEFPWQTRLEVRSADHPENLVGEALDGAIMSEAAKHKKETWERFIRPALADKRGFADFPTTPEGFNWLYDLWALGQNPEFVDFESWQNPSWANNHVYPLGREDPEILLIEKTTIRPWFLQEIAAEFSAFVGKIYERWRETDHVRAHVFNPAWPNYIAFDWGYTNPLAAIEFQVDPQDRVYVWREHYGSYQTLGWHLYQLKQRQQPEGYHLDLAFGDAADPAAAQEVSEKLVPCVAMPEAKENWREGIDLVNSLLWREVGADDEGHILEEPALFVDHSCVKTIREFNNYRAAPSVGGKNPREVAQKIDDHALDAIRYGVVHKFKLGAHQHLSDVYEPSVVGGTMGGQDASGFFTMGGGDF
jgi:hypothetical protein